MGVILDKVRKSLVNEASKSPNLLSDLAGLENYIGESYNSRSFIELLQNADDAGSSHMFIKRVDQHIIVANDGREFTDLDFESLCRSAASKKERKTNIGFRGIGFKSVVGFAKRVHIFSGQLEATFCRDLTSALIPQAGAVPLIRIPHPIDPELKTILFPEIQSISNSSFKTIFVFSDLIADFVENEFESLDLSTLLFLRNVNRITLQSSNPNSYIAERKEIDEYCSSVELSNNNLKQNWTVFSQGDIAIAARKENDNYKSVPSEGAVVHAFLPTSEQTGFGFKVNGNISTDPSRLRVIHDATTREITKQLANLYISLLKKCLDRANYFSIGNLIEILLPVFDPRILKLQKQSFQKVFIGMIQESANGKFSDFYRRPNWLNSSDSTTLASNEGLNIPPRDIGDIEGVDTLLKFLGVKEVTLDMLSNQLKTAQITTQGAAEIVSHITRKTSTKQISPDIIDKDWKIWRVDNKNVSLNKIVKEKTELDIDFVDIITEKVGVSSELPRLVSAVTDIKKAQIIIPQESHQQEEIIKIEKEENDQMPSRNVSIVKWRSAEQQVLEILNSDNWSAKDVSRQNIGYDIEAQNPQGKDIFVEVKSLKYEGQHFSLTSNEEATAREKGKAYVLALVIQKKEQLHVMFIENPLKVIKLERQCRQWVWLCSSYDFNPKIYEFQP